MDLVEGFVDDGCKRTSEIADHVQVWMLKGVYKKWKQPVAYTFCKSTTAAADIVRNFKTIVRRTTECGLQIIASICDQGTTNVKAIHMLVEESRRAIIRTGERDCENVIIIGNTKVIPIFDPPHLLKSLRNNLLTKPLKFTKDGMQRIAKWSHIVDAYNIDISMGDLRIMPKLFMLHVIPNKIKKMKVSLCTQVFSASVAAGVFHYSNNEKYMQLYTEGKDTAHLCRFLDKLFDTINGGEVLRNLGFQYFSTRMFNQDFLENFFGQVRQFGCRNTNPTCSCFIPYFKSLLIGNFATLHSKGSNCEDDRSEGPLITLKQFLTSVKQEVDRPSPTEVFLLPPELIHSEVNIDALSYIGEYVAKKVQPFCNSCSACYHNIMYREDTPSNKFIVLNMKDVH